MNLTTPPYSLSVVSNTVPAVFDTRGLDLGTGGAMRHCPRPSRVGDDAHDTAPLTPAAVTTPTGHMSGVTAANSHHPRYSPLLCMGASDAQIGASATREPFVMAGSRVVIAATVAAECSARIFRHRLEGDMPNRTPLPDLAADLLIDVQVAIASGQTDRAVNAAREAARVVAAMNRNRLRWIYEANHGDVRPDAA